MRRPLEPGQYLSIAIPSGWPTPASNRRWAAWLTPTITRSRSPSSACIKTELIRRQGPWRHLEAVEFATLEWVDWFNHRRLLAPIGHVPPAEYEQQCYRTQDTPAMVAGVT